MPASVYNLLCSPTDASQEASLKGTPRVLVLHSRELKLGEYRMGLEGERSMMLSEARRGMGTNPTKTRGQNQYKVKVHCVLVESELSPLD